MLMLLCCLGTQAQRFFNLTAEEVRIGESLPCFSFSLPLGEAYADSVYTASIVYPEFIDMSEADVRRYEALSQEALPDMPVVHQQVTVDRRQGALEVWFVPLVQRDRRYQKLVSFMLKIESTPVAKTQRAKVQGSKLKAQSPNSSRYASHSVLASGKWAKIRIPASGVYELTQSLVQKAGFSSLEKVKVYGYGGELQPEMLTGDYLTETDDLKEVPTCKVDGRRLFYGRGPVSWIDNATHARTRNPYSDYGYYFLTENDDEPLTQDEQTFLGSFYPSADDYHELHEVDNYAWFQGGRNLFEDAPVALGESRTFTIAAPAGTTKGWLTVALTAKSDAAAIVELNGEELGSMAMALGSKDYDKGCETVKTYEVSNLKETNSIRISTTANGPVRPDYFALTFTTAKAAPDLHGGSFGEPEYVYNITNQDHHADEVVDMVIVIPTTGKLRSQAERLKAHHEETDGLSVRIVPSDELINEFASGTPDANAYRRYMKMFYDRAENEAQMPKYLLLMGDCAWDNRMNCAEWRGLSPDDFLLCYESENSFSETDCYVSDDYFCLLDDDEALADGTSYYSFNGKPDIAVGRLPARNELQARIMVDKTINYVRNENAGGWQNVIMIMGDDGNNNIHMRDANEAAVMIEAQNPGLLVKRVMWDAYTRETSSTGNTYPEITKLIKQQQAAGALIMDYCGHGRADQLAHETILKLKDFEDFNNKNLPLWITASCDIMPYDSQTDNIGEVALLNEKGGAVAFFGTTRTVYADRNKAINIAYLKNVLNTEGGQRVSIGEAQRLTKNQLVNAGSDRTRNKLQYALLGDPALKLNVPTLQVVVDSINDKPVAANTPTLRAGSVAKVKGHIEKDGTRHTEFNGLLSATVRDAKEHIVCRLNDTSKDGASTAFEYDDHTKTLFSGSDNVTGGRFSFSFAVPMDISYTDGAGLINIYAMNNDHTELANGSCDKFIVGGSEQAANDSIGPSVFCYLNSPSFTNGGNVNATPYFVAEIKDRNGINTTGNGIGHDLELIIDGEMARTYILNDHFEYDFGSYTEGSTWYSIPELEVGPHKLLFRAWDILNNSTTTELNFNVVKGLEPNCLSVACTQNPATTSTTFIVNHDRIGSAIDVDIDVFDFAGRLLWNHRETSVPTTGAYTLTWNLTLDGGAHLGTGVYLYRARISCDGSSSASKAQKLIILKD